MKLRTGAIVGPYEILSVLGSGGMGEVYRARDPRLGRELALKVLPHSRASDPEALERFEREARSACAQNHPNIVVIYDVGREREISYIAMELVEGRSLRAILRDESPAIRSILALANQVAGALACLHDREIVHRDLKPENILVTPTGTAKLLDFGLARLGGLSRTSESSTEDFLTAPGRVLGTVSYMSPEQAAGGTIATHSDQFSFGTILYEMITGRRPFDRATAVETLAAIIREDPIPIHRLQPAVPAPLVWAVERCLAKKPQDRYASTRDLARDLEAMTEHLSAGTFHAAVSEPALPVPRTRLLGREAELDALRDLLDREEIRLVTLTGVGGSGKTCLALEVARSLVGKFGGCVWFVPLASISDPGFVLPTVAQALRIRSAGGRPIQELLGDLLSGPAAKLLVLDNFEQVVEAAPAVAALMESARGLKCLVTSRAPLHIYGEYEFPVPPLAVPELRGMESAESLRKLPSVALFIERASALRPDLLWSDENVRAAAEIAARVDGLPLAVELAAARVKIFPPVSLRARLEKRLDLLTGGARDMPARHQTLRQTIDWSHDLLDPLEQKLFRRLSVFAGGFTLEAAEAVADARQDLGGVLEQVASLVDKNLIVGRGEPGGEPRFTLLEIIREYGLERLEESGEEESVRRAHAAYFLLLAEDDNAPGQTEAEQIGWLDRFDLEIDNFRAAFDWLTRTGRATWGLRMATALLRFWDERGRRIEGHARLDALLALPAEKQTRHRARAIAAKGILSMHYPDERGLEQEGLAIDRALGDLPGVLQSLTVLAGSYHWGGDCRTARGLYEEAVVVAREIGDQAALAGALNNVAVAARPRAVFIALFGFFELRKIRVSQKLHYPRWPAAGECWLQPSAGRPNKGPF